MTTFALVVLEYYAPKDGGSVGQWISRFVKLDAICRAANKRFLLCSCCYGGTSEAGSFTAFVHVMSADFAQSGQILIGSAIDLLKNEVLCSVREGERETSRPPIVGDVPIGVRAPIRDLQGAAARARGGARLDMRQPRLLCL